ncbi:signal peptidase II [Bifidobacterium callimiconis]|uniref:Lipoprotein signal peptidase n=1 Tax=Bifidobacterium callimiconis TaxID=2306973 RepID=A0A430FF39_9BIFI|nr:signal peptidase II [Bifidobacterium callimiconis]MBT1176138.1 signal peptidase II [Bifidobacterium callimiconis]RSX51515.1 lipoprotein signal peptidase [Bifidobacterium callimiconis]
MTENTVARRPRTRVAVFACVALVALVLDRITKNMALASLNTDHDISVIPGLLSLRLLHNPGASLGMGSSTTWLISLLAIVASIALLVAGVMTTDKRWAICLGLAFGGAVGNLIDRVMYATGFLDGRVVDFLNYGWSVGNVADIWLMVAGIGLVLLIVLSVPFRPTREGAADTAPHAYDKTEAR